MSTYRDKFIKYLAVSVFCLLIYLVYNHFSHGVHSPYMTYLFAWPLILGALPSLLLTIRERAFRRHACASKTAARRQDEPVIAAGLYRTGLAAVTVSSLLRGILEIAGTSSVYQSRLMWVGAGLMVIGGVSWMLARRSRSKNIIYSKRPNVQ